MKWGLILGLGLAIGASVAGAASDEVLLGAITYNGGFVQNLQLTVSRQAPVKYFRVAIPQFCGQVDILEAGTITEGVTDVAQPVDAANHVYSVNGGAGERVGAVVLSLNGPSSAQCAIPIYASEDASTGSPAPDVGGNEVQLCNVTTANVSAALVYPENGNWVSQGWWRLAPGECESPRTPTPIVGTFYYYAFADNGLAWGNGPQFCVNPSSHFKLSQQDCTSRPGLQFQQFTQSYRETNTLHRVQFAPN